MLTIENTFRESVGLLTTRRFGTFWFASLLSNIGTWAQQVANPGFFSRSMPNVTGEAWAHGLPLLSV